MDKQTQTEVEAAVFRRLVEHLDANKDVQNIDLMILADFCRNCLAKWYSAAASEQGVLVKGRGRGGSVLRAQAAGKPASAAVQSAPVDVTAAAQVGEVSAGYLAEAARVVKAKASAQPATGIEDMKKTLWATADKLRAQTHVMLGDPGGLLECFEKRFRGQLGSCD